MDYTATDWEGLYRLGETPWEKGRPHPALIDFLKEHGPLDGDIFVPCCGSGHDVRALSNANNRVLGVDLARRAIQMAKAQPQVGHEEYLLANLFQLPNEWSGRFDWVFEHTCFCAIDPKRRNDFAAAMARLLRRGGRLLAIFFTNPDNDDDGPPYPVSVEELEELFGKSFTLEREWVPQRTHPGREQRELMRLMRKTG